MKTQLTGNLHTASCLGGGGGGWRGGPKQYTCERCYKNGILPIYMACASTPMSSHIVRYQHLVMRSSCLNQATWEWEQADVSSPPHISWAMPIRGAEYVLNLNNNRAGFGSHSKTMLGGAKGESQCRVIEMPRALRWWNSCLIGDTFLSQKWLQGLGSVGGSLGSHWFHQFCQEKKNILTMVYLHFFCMTSLRYCIKV